jgi:MFS superfamily sulfate permease-like transporter
MKEENLSSFDARQLILGEHDIIKSCILFITRRSIIIVYSSGASLRVVILILVAFAAGLLGLILRNVTLFVGGLSAGIVIGMVIAMVDFMFRRRRLKKMKRLSPERILQMSEKNFEVPYEKIVKVEVRESKVYPQITLFLPMFEEHYKYVVGFLTDENKYLFILDADKLQSCLNLIREFAPKTIHIEEDFE